MRDIIRREKYPVMLKGIPLDGIIFFLIQPPLVFLILFPVFFLFNYTFLPFGLYFGRTDFCSFRFLFDRDSLFFGI